MFTPYQPNVPTGRVFLSIDYANVMQNFGQLNTIFGIDHTALTLAANSGYHQAIHLVPQTTGTYPPAPPPATVPNIGTFFSSIVNDGNSTDTALYFLTGNGLLSQLTSNFLAVSNTNGCTFLPGGIIVNWGFSALPGVQPIVFAANANNKAFPNACYGVWTQQIFNSAPTGQSTLSIKLNTRLSFNWQWNTTGSTVPNSFFWIAIGH